MVNFNYRAKRNGADPMEMSYLLGIAGGCLTAVLLLACLCIYAIRARKCCFKGKFAHLLFIMLYFFGVNFNIFSGHMAWKHNSDSNSWIISFGATWLAQFRLLNFILLKKHKHTPIQMFTFKCFLSIVLVKELDKHSIEDSEIITVTVLTKILFSVVLRMNVVGSKML